MDQADGLTADQITKLASMVGAWTPRSGAIDDVIFGEDAPRRGARRAGEDAVGRLYPAAGPHRVTKAELESHTYRVLTIIEDRKLGADLGCEKQENQRSA